MGRAPCCEKMGLKKGPWTPEEDRVLINYIQQQGHPNWRALPKQAGLLRCGKSCRLRWTNYLRPDIKRGNFTKEEEDTIIQLHQMMGSRWSAIAARLPGRTDNEIKNVWHTRLQKRLKQDKSKLRDSKGKGQTRQNSSARSTHDLPSPQRSSSALTDSFGRFSAVVVCHEDSVNVGMEDEIKMATSPIQSTPLAAPAGMDQKLWSASEVDNMTTSRFSEESIYHPVYDNNYTCDGEAIDFWYNVFISSAGSTELPEI
ncbi:hypothetical protein Dimus_001025 [Dionaea muscipula]